MTVANSEVRFLTAKKPKIKYFVKQNKSPTSPFLLKYNFSCFSLTHFESNYKLIQLLSKNKQANKTKKQPSTLLGSKLVFHLK